MELGAKNVASSILRAGSFADWVKEGDSPYLPGTVLHALIQESGFSSMRSFATASNITTVHLHLLLHGKRRLTSRVAVHLGKTLDVDPTLLVELQTNFDLWSAYQKESHETTRNTRSRSS